MSHGNINLYKAIELYKKHRSWRRVAELMPRDDGSLFTPYAFSRKVSIAREGWRLAGCHPRSIDIDFEDDEVLPRILEPPTMVPCYRTDTVRRQS